MTSEQKSLFISIASTGVACGLWHPLEWYVNYTRSMMNFCKYEDIPKKEKEAEECMIEFLKLCAHDPYDPLLNLTSEKLNKMINDYYQQNQNQKHKNMKGKTPSGFIAKCQCGSIIGAIDYNQTEKNDFSKIMGTWLIGGYIIEPRYDSWSERITPCKCKNN